MPPMIPATASKSLLSFTANTASTCITRCFSSKPKPALCSPPSFAPAMPLPQRASPLSLSRLVPILKQRFPNSQISYRADAGSATPEIYRTLESFEMLYAIGIASNSVFKKRTERWLKKANAQICPHKNSDSTLL